MVMQELSRRTFLTRRRALDRAHRDVESVVAAVERTASMTLVLAPADLSRAVGLLGRSLGPKVAQHMAWEERHWFPVIDQETGTRWVSQQLRWQHGQLDRAIDDVERRGRGVHADASREQTNELLQALLGLHAILHAHMAQEETVVVAEGMGSADGRGTEALADGLGLGGAVPGSGERALLTSREREVVGLLAEQCTTAQIAAILGIGEGTVGARLRDIRSAIGPLSREEMVLFARERALI
jgi:DNA-binding CsgD family transcriptional regulator